MLFVGAMSKSTNPLDPLAKFSSTTTVAGQISTTQKSLFTRVATVAELKTTLSQATKPVMLDFYADWCVSCVELEHYTFSDPRVQDKLKNFTLLQVDVTKNSDEDKALLKEFGLFGPPAIMFFKNSEELTSLRLIGFKDAQEFLTHLEKI
jgi:thiol:disulfide interchange protein DsbD